jgi:3',5'-cyclic AMP phosphodiesterase CpdA
MLTILHGSDLHFGKPFDARVAGIFQSAIEEMSPDLLVLSGDFTQRAKVREYREAREFLRSLPEVPTVVTPGNHDVPLYRVWERILAPMRNYREFISPELDTLTSIPGVTVVSLNTTAPYRAIVNGRLKDRQLLFAADGFHKAPEGDLRLVVLHHHLAPAPDYESDQVLPGFQKCLEAFGKMKVDLILGGHLHRAYVADSRDVLPAADGRHSIIIAHSGTTTSRRGRARERNKNSFNLIGVTRDHLVITHYVCAEEGGGFLPVGTHTFPRRPLGALEADPVREGLFPPDRGSMGEREEA